MSLDEHAVVFECAGEHLCGIVHPARRAAPGGTPARGVLVIVGGPQYRVGSHRQFVLLARDLAAAGVPAMRFDYRGMGDSSGPPRSFEDVDEDVRAALACFASELPELREFVLLGLCDAASAALFYAPTDARVKGLVLLNPWVRTEQGLARSYLRHWYLSRLASGAFWRKALSGRLDLRATLASLLGNVAAARGGRRAPASAGKDPDDGPDDGPDGGPGDDAGAPRQSARAPLPDRMAQAFARFDGAALLILSGNDLTAGEFEDTVRGSRRWRRLVGRAGVERHRLPAANHTFSRQAWRDEVSRRTVEWVRSW